MHLTFHPTLLWYAPLVLLTGVYGTHTAYSVRRMAEPNSGKTIRSLLIIGWFPALIWIIQQFHF